MNNKVEHGEWVVEAYSVDGDDVVIIPFKECQHNEPFCSICGKYALLNGGEEYVCSAFCPNCGAKMDGESMTDKKLTDEDIISSLEVTVTTRNCNECKIRNCKWGTCNCEQITDNAALELINCYKNEIERIQKEANLVSIQFQDLQERTDEIKAEACKEFAERLKEKYGIFTPLGVNWIEEVKAVRVSDIDNLLKEMIGEENV